MFKFLRKTNRFCYSFIAEQNPVRFIKRSKNLYGQEHQMSPLTYFMLLQTI